MTIHAVAAAPAFAEPLVYKWEFDRDVYLRDDLVVSDKNAVASVGDPLDTTAFTSPVLSPGGQFVAFAVNSNDLAIASADGSGWWYPQIADGCCYLEDPSWHPEAFVRPNEDDLVFAADAGIMSADFNGGQATCRLARPPNASFVAPQVSPDGSAIYYIRRSGNAWGLYKRSWTASCSDDAASTLVTELPPDSMDFSIARNGRRLAVINRTDVDRSVVVVYRDDGSLVGSVETGLDSVGALSWAADTPNRLLLSGMCLGTAGGADCAGYRFVLKLVDLTSTLGVERAQILGSTPIVPGFGGFYNGASYRTPCTAQVCADEGPTAELLERFTPEMRYDDEESFVADSAATMTAWSGNELRDGEDNVIAVTGGIPSLSLSNLDVEYGPSYPATDADRVVENNGPFNEEEAAAFAAGQMHESAAFGDEIYGRVVPGRAGTTWLQYWFFYYYNPAVPFSAGFGAHEGDWEMVQIGLDQDLQPREAIYAQHDSATRCDWEDVDINADGAPRVYVALNSHASYFRPGTYALPATAIDVVQGDADPVMPDATAFGPQRWLDWPGRWGGTRAGGGIPVIGGDPAERAEQDSPEGPAFQGDKWSAPDAWARSADFQCIPDASASQTPTTSATLPVTLNLDAERQANRILVDYSAISGASVPQNATVLITAARAAGGPPVARAWGLLMATHAGEVQLRLPSGDDGPLVIRASAFASTGLKSEESELLLP